MRVTNSIPLMFPLLLVETVNSAQTLKVLDKYGLNVSLWYGAGVSESLALVIHNIAEVEARPCV
jgi:hypothetical protein